MLPLRHFCKIHKKEFWSTRNNFQIQAANGKKGYGCPDCVKISRPYLTGTSNPSFGGVSHRLSARDKIKAATEKAQRELDEKFGIGVLKLVSDYAPKQKMQFLCSACKTTTLRNWGRAKNSVYPCSCVRIRETVPFARLREREKDFVVFLYRDLLYTFAQVSEVTGIAVSTARAVIKAYGVDYGANENNFRRVNAEKIGQGKSFTLTEYNRKIKKFTGYVYRAYKDIIDPKRLRGSEYHLDHRLSKSHAYSKYDTPLPLRVVCHPMNLKVVTARENLTKNHKSTLTLSALKRRIKKFDSEYGPLVFPKHLQTEFVKTPQVQIKHGLNVLGFDPGTANFGVFGGTLFGVRSLHRVQVKISKMLEHPLTTLTGDFHENSEAFAEEVRELLREIRPQVIVFERFQARGLRGPVVELISVMLGIVTGLARKFEADTGKRILIKVVTASQWKNRVNQVTALDDMYATMKAKDHHRLDACLMALSAFPAEQNVYEALTPSRREALCAYMASK